MNSNKSIITKAFAIAKRNGFDVDEDIFIDVRTDSWLISDQKNYYNLIFDHRFAKALYGKSLVTIDPYLDDEEEERPLFQIDLVRSIEDGKYPIAGLIYMDEAVEIPAWQYHLTHMVLSPNPIDYIGKYLEEFEKVQKNIKN
mgnify:CR=1 FL=1|jgi:hypothetical protein